MTTVDHFLIPIDEKNRNKIDTPYMNVRSFSWLCTDTSIKSGVAKEEFEDNKGAIRIRISKTKRQHNGQKNKRTYNDLKQLVLCD